MENKNRCVHYVGFRSESEWHSANRVWGGCDYYHHVNDGRVREEVDWDNDVVVYGSSYDKKQYVYNDSEHV